MRRMLVFGTSKRRPYLFSTAGFLDDSWFNRTQWAVGAVSRAQLLVFDERRAYCLGAYLSTARSRFFKPGSGGYHLFAANLIRGKTTPSRIRGRRSVMPSIWRKQVPIRAKAMALAGATLFACGAPDVVDPEDPLGALEGRKGALLCAFEAASGKKLSQLELDALPVWDGMAVARGRLYLATRDGKIRCFGGN